MRARMRFLVPFFLFASGCASTAPQAVAHVEPPRVPAVARTVDVEVTDTTSAGSRTTRYTLALVDDNGWSEVSTGSQAEHMRLKARSNRMHGDFPTVIDVDLSRNVQGAPGIDLRQSAIFFAGRRTILGHVDRENGFTEVAMVTR